MSKLRKTGELFDSDDHIRFVKMDLIKALRLYISKMIEESGPGMKVRVSKLVKL